MTNKVKIPRNTPKQVVQEIPTEPVMVPVNESPAVTAKRVLLSKTIWVNLLSLLAIFLQQKYGFIFSEDLQLQLLTLINIALRFVTKEPIAWGGSSGNNKENS